MIKKKKRKLHVMKVGTNKKIVLMLWILLIFSTLFGVYKNFTAIDTHTIIEKEVIELRLQDTNGVENFVRNFVKAYYTWTSDKEDLAQRTETINTYMTKELQTLNIDSIRSDIPTKSIVKDIQMLAVKPIDKEVYEVLYTVTQTIEENDNSKDVHATYSVKVYIDDKESMIIIQNPTLAKAINTSDYEPKPNVSDTTITTNTKEEVTAFLETFFKLYPSATTNELAYYMRGNVLPQINGDYIFAELINPVFTKEGDNLIVNVAVKYLDQQTKAIQISQYKLTLHHNDNWIIVDKAN